MHPGATQRCADCARRPRRQGQESGSRFKAETPLKGYVAVGEGGAQHTDSAQTDGGVRAGGTGPVLRRTTAPARQQGRSRQARSGSPRYPLGSREGKQTEGQWSAAPRQTSPLTDLAGTWEHSPQPPHLPVKDTRTMGHDQPHPGPQRSACQGKIKLPATGLNQKPTLGTGGGRFPQPLRRIREEPGRRHRREAWARRGREAKGHERAHTSRLRAPAPTETHKHPKTHPEMSAAELCVTAPHRKQPRGPAARAEKQRLEEPHSGRCRATGLRCGLSAARGRNTNRGRLADGHGPGPGVRHSRSAREGRPSCALDG